MSIDLTSLPPDIRQKIEYFRSGFESEKICRECRWYRPCRHICLLLTRQTDLSLWFASVNRCPLHDRPQERQTPAVQPVDNTGLVSVIILARNEPLLQKTIDNLQETAQEPIEFVIVLDGPGTPEPRPMDNMTIIRHERPHGRRPSTNEAAAIARGKYLFHLDAHVRTDTIGWDVLLKRACVENKTMVIPSLDRLILPEFRCKGRRFGHKYITIKMKDAWSGIKPRANIEPTICGNGMGWFLEKNYYDALGGCDESYGPIWGNFGLEWALKVWLTDPDGRGPGQVLLSREVVFAHQWKNDVGYATPGVDAGRQRLYAYVSGTAPRQVRPFAFLEETLGHLIPYDATGDKRPLLANRPAVTVIMNTNGLYPDLLEEAIESFLRQDYPDKRLLIVNTHPTPLQIINMPDIIEVQNIQPFERFPQQIAYAIKQVKTPYWCVMDSDDIFFSGHISQLVDRMLRARREGLPIPGYVCVPKAWEQWAGRKPKQRHRGWWCCLYDRVDAERVDAALDSFFKTTDADTGFDLHFIKQPWWTRRDYDDTEITVLHRLGVGFHIGHHDDSHAHYTEGISRSLREELRVLEPHWDCDYEAEMGYSSEYHILIKNHLGDCICAEPAIRNLKAQHRMARIIVYSRFPDVFKDNPSIYASLALSDSRRVTHTLKVRRGLHLVDWLTPDATWCVDRRPVIHVRADIERFGIDFGKPTVVISTRTHAVHKRWNREKWRAIVAWLRAMGYQTIQVGHGERDIGCDIYLSDQTSISELAEICRRSHLYVGIDAGVQHVAVAVGTPAVVLYGPADPATVVHEGWTEAVQSGVCRDCWTRDRIGRHCPKGDALCMYSITVEQVQAAIMRMI